MLAFRRVLFALIIMSLFGLRPSMRAEARADAPGWQTECVDCPKRFADMTGRSLRLDAAGQPHIAYGYDHLYYAWHDGSSWHLQTVDSAGGVGSFASLALDGAGHPHISYYDATNYDLKYARWTGSAWQIETVDSERAVGQYTSLALGAGDQPPTIYNYTSLALDAGDNPHISYCVSQGAGYGVIKYARWMGSAWQIETVDSAGQVGLDTSLALDVDGHPHISYHGNGTLKYARWTGSAWQIETVDSGGNVGEYTSLALDAGGNPHISYYDGTNGDLKYAKRLSLSRTLSLPPGWNLISLPLAPANTDITQALASIASRYDRVYAYDAADAAQPWRSYSVSKPPFLNSLTAVSETQGLWIRVSDAVSLTITGTAPVSAVLPLRQGWNLVGYPSQTTRPVTQALASIAGKYDLVYAYDAANAVSPWRKYNVAAPAFLNTLKELGPGWGYWIRATQDCTWQVP